MVLVEMSVGVMVCMQEAEISCVNKGDRMVVMLWQNIEKMAYARKWGHCGR